jgi:integrase
MPGGTTLRLSNWRLVTFIPARASAGLSGRFRIHDLRHTAASLMIQAGYPPRMLQEIMGHASITTTLDLYGHPVPRRDGPLRGPARGHSGGCRSGQNPAR